MGADVLFGELRSLLQEAPSEEVWERVCEQLDLWPPEALEAVALPYVLEHVARWPATVERLAPLRWMDGSELAQAKLALSHVVGEGRGIERLEVATARPEGWLRERLSVARALWGIIKRL
jgi:hypothetical protein